MPPPISDYFAHRQPSGIRLAQIAFASRPDRDRVEVINTAIGNVSLPMHPAMRARLRALGDPDNPFERGVVKYTPTVGTDEAQQAFLNVIGSMGVDTEDLRCVVTDGGSQAMELMILGVCGPGSPHPLALLDPAYTNYMLFAHRVAVPTVSVRRTLGDDGIFALPDLGALEQTLRASKARALVIIPADNPTGQHMRHEDVVAVARLCVEHDLWLVGDEAYRQLHYEEGEPSSVWRLTERDVPGIRGRRISIESASKVWNACGLRIGALVTDSAAFATKAVAEYTANLCSNAIGQYIFGALAHETHDALHDWYAEQRAYYAGMMNEVASGLQAELPGLIVSRPQAALYSVVDVRAIAPEDFDAAAFVHWCATTGKVALDGVDHTLLVAPMAGFYGDAAGAALGRTQMRLAFVEPVAQMAKVPPLFAALFRAYGGRSL